jgi:hypothetical protein
MGRAGRRNFLAKTGLFLQSPVFFYLLEENLSPVEIEARYFQGRYDQYHAFERVHFARAVVAK